MRRGGWCGNELLAGDVRYENKLALDVPRLGRTGRERECDHSHSLDVFRMESSKFGFIPRITDQWLQTVPFRRLTSILVSTGGIIFPPNQGPFSFSASGLIS